MTAVDLGRAACGIGASTIEQKRNILAVLIAGAINLGLTRMSEACGVSYDTLAWTQEWYVREETLREANTVLVNHHYRLELAKSSGAAPCPPPTGSAPLCAARA